MTYRHPSGVHYMKRKLGTLGKVERTLGTTNQEIARARERMLLSLADRGRLDLVRAWLDGRLGIDVLQDAYEASALAKLTEKLERVDEPLSDAVMKTLKAKKPDVAPSTLTRYAQGLAHFERLVDVALVADALTTERINEFKAARLEEKAARETINNDLQAVSVLVTLAIERGWIPARPTVKRYKPKTRIRYLDRGQLAAYMASLRPAFRPQMELLVSTGMRLGETEGVTVDSIRSMGAETHIIVDKAKTETGVRTVHVPEWAGETLRRVIEGGALTGSDALFTIPRRSVQEEHKRACGIAGIRGYTVHDHRHTFAVHACMAEMPITLVKEQLGHTRIEQTMKYAHFHPAYSDVGPYLKAMGERLGLAPQGENRGDVTREQVGAS